VSREAKILIAILIIVVGGLIGLFALANKTTPPPAGDKNAVVRDDSYKQGSGPIQVVEFGDYQCPACGQAYPILKQIEADFKGKVTFYFRNFPLTQLHPNANAAANAAEAAGAQGKYWEMHDKLYETQSDWGDLTKNLSAADAEAKWVGYAKDLGLDADKFKSAVENQQYQSRIDQDVADGNAQGINGTPTIYVNGQKVDNFSYASIRDAINAALAASPSPSPSSSPSASPHS